MEVKNHVFRFLFLTIWGNTPGLFQKAISYLHTRVYQLPFSKHFIKPYCKLQYTNQNYLAQFSPGSGGDSYRNFQDFFTRKLKQVQLESTEFIWPCEGLLCEYSSVELNQITTIKGDRRGLSTVFAGTIPEGYYYYNVFLHNKNYHRIHAPVSGTVKRIERVKGKLHLLRPWYYKKHPSYPALKNERVLLEITDNNGENWFLAIVGGPAVGSIRIPEEIYVGCSVSIGQELSLFKLGSTCCVATPRRSTYKQKGDFVYMGQAY